MKKLLIIFMLLCTMSIAYMASAEESAQDISKSFAITGNVKKQQAKEAFDRDYVTFLKFKDAGDAIEFHSDEPCYGMYICWAEPPKAWQLLRYENDAWVLEKEYEESSIVHQFYPLNGLSKFKVKPIKKSSKAGIAEVFLFSEGAPPSFVQNWNISNSKADLLVLFAHPDDEVLFLGGTLPYYAGHLKKEVIAATLTCGNRARRSELLNSLWTCGVKNYPVFLDIPDVFSKRLDRAYASAGKKKVLDKVTTLFRKYRPDVVVTQDINGEYGHGQHRICADAAIRCFKHASDESYILKNNNLPTWQIKKLYLHLWKENSVIMDWDEPLDSFGGKSAFEVAKEAYAHHKTQHRYKQFKVEPKDSKYSCYHFGLHQTSVGLDSLKNDFFENIVKGE